MEEIFPGQFPHLQEHLKNKTVFREELTDVRLDDFSGRSSQLENIIPVVLKRYLKGGLTEPLVQKMMNNHKMTLTMSSEQGLGLQLGELAPGKVIIIAGGTGLLPFSDIIDLLFKKEYARANPQYAQRFCEVSPILNRPFLENIIFDLYASFNAIEDIHPLTLHQLSFLTKSSKIMRVTLKLSTPVS